MSSKDVDRLSELPEEIRSHVLSLMPTKFAVETSILSKRWRYTWTFVTNLDFDVRCYRFPDFVQFVDSVLESCKASRINLFRVILSHYNTRARNSNVLNWIDKAVKLNVREVHISSRLYEYPSSLFTCKTLTILRIGYGCWDCPCSINLPSLKILDFARFKGPFVFLSKLISGSPMLECLSLELSSNNCVKEYIFNIPSLKRLKLIFKKFNTAFRGIVLNVPNLEYLHVSRYLCSSFVIEDLSSLVEASISLDFVFFGFLLWIELLKGLSGVKSLSLAFSKDICISHLPIFPNLKHLELKKINRCGQILSFLENCPKLEHLYIEHLVDIHGWNKIKSVPDCIRMKLTTLKFSSTYWRKPETGFLKYMLGNAEVLQTVTITLDKSTSEEEEEGRLLAQLIKLKRASGCCEIRFHGNDVSFHR